MKVWVVGDALLDGETIVGDVEIFRDMEDARRRADELGVSFWPKEVEG